MKRRALLHGCLLAALPLAGCTGDSPATRAGTASPTPSPTPNPTRLTDTTFSVTGSGCGEVVERASVAFDRHEETVAVTGTTSTPDGCYRVVLEAARYDDGADELRVAVATRETTAGACAQCIYEFTYEATCSFEHGLPGTVVVTHDGDRVATASPNRG